jgi:Bacterial PH domain
MVEWLRRMLQLDAQEAIDLGPDEQILHVIGRHWVVLLARLILPVLGVLGFGGLALYRALGGAFLVTETNIPIGLDFFNWALLTVIVGLTLLWFALFVRGKKAQRSRNIVLGVGAGIVLLIWFRYNGGRVFFVDPIFYSGQQTDTLNVALILLAVVSSIFVLFTFYDWLNDELILTNQRVVYDNDQVFIPRLLEQRVQEQIFLDEVQDVSAKTATYPQHLLNFGTVTIKSARIGGNIVFDAANGPIEMQRQIMNQVKALQKRMSTASLDTLIEERVYGNKPPRGKLKATIKQTRGAAALSWVFLENPEFNEDNGTYTWRPHWLFQIQALIGPMLLLVIGLFVVAIVARILVLDPVLVALLTIVVLLVFAAWTAWEIEDYRNDRYILNPTNVVDIEKKPFGPEDQRRASLGSITNVSFSTTFISNLLGYGDVILETAGAGGKFTFDHVPRPNEVVTVINDYIVQFKRGESLKNLDNTADLLARYHEAQRRHNELNAPTP